MKIPITADGTWWLPKFSDMKVQGRLAFSVEDGTGLELYDQFPDPLMAELAKVPIHPYTPDLIVGTIEGRTPCTLVNNFCTELGPRPRFISEYLLLGTQFQLAEDLQFQGLSFRLGHLEEWTGITPLEPPDEKDPFVIRLRRFDSILHPQSLYEASFAQPVAGHVTVTSHFSPVFGIARFSSEHIVEVRASFSRSVCLNESLQFVHDCRNFFTLVVGRDAPPFRLQLYTDDFQQLNAMTRHAELFYSGIGAPASQEIHPDEMLLQMSSINDIGTVFSNWLNHASEFRLGANWLLGTARKRGYLETDFLGYTQAVEALHRLKNPSRVPLGQRLQDLVGDGTAIAGVWEVTGFVDKVVKTRNFLVHHDPALASDAASGEELFKLAIGLRRVVTLFLLTSVDVPRDTAIRSVLRTRWRY
jgi:ApeA N-terminal domain 1/Apea-like HEPN